MNCSSLDSKSDPSISISHANDKCTRSNNYQSSSTGDLRGTLCMQGGDGDGSYARNCEAPASAIALSKPSLLKAINRMNLFRGEASLHIADLGCGTGFNSLSTIDLVVESIKKRYARESISVPEFEAFFSDLPLNDFNTLFRSLPHLCLRENDEKPKKLTYYAAGVPGSFYERLFPRGKLHVAISLSALHWLSRIPEAVLDKNSPAWNQGRAWIDGAKKEVVEAFAKQSEEDLKAFLRCRAEEMVSGGLLFILMAGRSDSEHPENQLGDPDTKAKHPFTNVMDQAWNDLVKENLIDEETRDAFNIPAYMRSREEIRRAFNQSKAFEIKSLKFRKVMEHSKEKQEKWIKDPISYGKTKANLVRATLRPIIDAHLRSSHLSQEFFKRFEKRAAEDINLLEKMCYYGIFVVSSIRK